MLLVSSSAAAAPIGRLRRWSLTRSKDRKAQDQHFVRTNSGRWVKTEHPLIATDDEDDEARRRREQVAVHAHQESETQRHDSYDNSNSLPFDVQHDTQNSDLDDPNQDGPLIPPWHATRPPMHWNPYPTSNPADPVPTTFRPGHTYSHSHPSDPNLASDSPAEDGSSDGAAKGNIHVPPAPVAFPTPSYVIAPPKQEERRGRVRRKPGSLYPLHNDTKPPQPYINWHLRPPDLDLPPIFAPANYYLGGGSGQGSGAHGKGASTPGTDGAGQTVSANGSATGHSGGGSRPRTRENSRDGRAYPPSTQPPKLQLATSAILGHSVSQASLRPGPASALPVESHNPSPTPSHSDAALPPHATPGDTMQPHGSAIGPSAAVHPVDPTKLDLADAWGTDWRYSSPYDLGQGPMGGLAIPAPGSYQPGTSPSKKKDPSPSPLGHRSRRASREPLDRSGRTSEDRGRPSGELSRPTEYVPSPLSATPDKPVYTVQKKTSTLGRVFHRGDDETDDEGEHRKKGGLRALFHGSATNLHSPGDDGFMPRVRKRTISLGQTGIGIGLPSIGGISAPRTRKQSFEVVRKPSVRPQGPAVTQAEPAKPVVTEAVADADTTAPTAKEPLHVETAAGSSRVLPDAEYANSPTDERERSHSRADDGQYSARPSLELQRNSTQSQQTRTSRDLARSPSSQSRFMISGPMPLRKSPSSGSIKNGISQILGHKKSASHLGHGAADGIGLGRNSSTGSTNGPLVIEPPPRGRKLSNLRGPPRTLHRYAPNMEQFDVMYASRPRRDSETSKSSKRGSGGVVGKLAKKLSWITKSKEEKERELEVEERMRQYEKERDLERRLEEARAKATFEDEVRRSRREPSQDAVREPEPAHEDESQLEDMPMPSRPFADPVMSPDRVTMDFRKSDIQPALNLFHNLDDNGSVKNGIQFPLASPAVKPAPLDPRSPAMNMRRGLFQPPGHDGIDSPKPANQGLTPLGKLASVMMSKPPQAPLEAQPTSGSSLFSPLAAAANLLSPKKASSNNNLTQSLMSPGPSAPAVTLDSTPTKGHTRAGSSDGHGSSVQGHGRRPSRGPSPVPPRPQTPPARHDSPLSLPRMTLMLMNPDTPSPPTPVQALPPDNWPSRRSMSPVHKPVRTPPKSPPKSPPRKSTVPDEVLQQRMERMANMPWSDPITSESETEKAKTRPAVQPWSSPAPNPGMMSPSSQPFPQMEQTPALGYGQFAMTPAAAQIPFPSFDGDSANRASTMSTPRASLQPAMPASEPQSQSQSSSSGSQIMSPSQSQIMFPTTQSQIMSPSTQSQLMSPTQQSQVMSPMSQLMSPPSDYHRQLANYAIAPQATRSSESLATYSPQTGLILQGGLMTTVAVMMLSPPQRESLEPLPPMQQSHNPVPAPPQMIPSPYTSGQGIESLDTPPTSSESEAPAPKERVGSSHAMISYEPAPPARPSQPTHSASDPLTPRQKPSRPHPRRGDTVIPAMGQEWEIVPDEKGHLGSDGRVPGSSSKHKRRTSSKQHSGNVIVEDIRQLDPYEAIKERERQVIDEREIAREKARDDWERQRDQEKQAAREQRRRDREAAREREREATREREAREREAREREAAREQEREAAKEREREAAKEAERQRAKEREASEREHRRLQRRASKLARSSTVSSIPPTPPPKERDLRPKVSKSQSSSSSSAAPQPPRTPSRHRGHHRTNTVDSILSQAPPPPVKSNKLSKSSSRRESPANVDPARHALDQKPLPRPMSPASGDVSETPVRSPRGHAKAATVATERRDTIESALGKSMPALPAMISDNTSPTRYQFPDHTRMMSPQSNGRASLASPSVHGSAYTSFSLQSPYMNTPGRASLGYEPAPRERGNPLPRPPRDISIDLSL